MGHGLAIFNLDWTKLLCGVNVLKIEQLLFSNSAMLNMDHVPLSF